MRFATTFQNDNEIKGRDLFHTWMKKLAAKFSELFLTINSSVFMIFHLKGCLWFRFSLMQPRSQQKCSISLLHTLRSPVLPGSHHTAFLIDSTSTNYTENNTLSGLLINDKLLG